MENAENMKSEKRYNQNDRSEMSFEDKTLTLRKKVSGFTIDSENSLDLDDGINIFKQNSKTILQVSIADVAHFVKKDDDLFKEAFSKVQTQYFKNHTIHMFPTALSENKFSLLKNKSTPAITFEFLLNEKFQVENVDIYESVFTSDQKISYSGFDSLINHQIDQPENNRLLLASQTAQQLLKRRRQQGALAIYDIKHLIYTNEEGYLLSLSKEKAHNANIVIQEFMILTNQAVAELMAKNDFPVLFRNHTVRNNAPDRNEIINQYNTALLDLTLIEQLSIKSAIWFNRANYDQQLKGHFGLNLHCYTHITSPIRRIADLINQFQLKRYLHSESSHFSKQELNEISSFINAKLAERKEDKAEYLKQKARKEAEKIIALNNLQLLNELDANNLTQVLKSLCQSIEIPEGLAEVIKSRLGQEMLDSNHLYLVLFSPKANEAAWEDVTRIILEYLESKQGLSNQILNIATQKSLKLCEINEDILEEDVGFLARIIGKIDDKIYSTDKYSRGSNKKEAKHKASNAFLTQYLRNELVLSERTIKPEKEKKTNSMKTEMKNAENYIGMLNEIHMLNSAWSMPEYIFSQQGTAHSPEITCTCILKNLHDTFETTGLANNRKTAKQLAAGEMYKLVQTRITDPIQPGRILTFEIDLDSTVNYTGLLVEYCQKKKCKQPKITYEERETNICCRLKFIHQSQSHLFSGMGKDEKQARKAASYECLKFLKENPDNGQ